MGDCVTFLAAWDTPFDVLTIDMSIPFDPGGATFTPPPSSFFPVCGETPVKSRCVFVEPSLTQTTDPPSIDEYAVDPDPSLGSDIHKLKFHCPFQGSICFQFCCHQFEDA
jgi:hypothetical protein